MAREYARRLYNSKAWKTVRNAYYVEKLGLCELCQKPGDEVHHKTFINANNVHDTNVTLNQDNLILLCKTCHSAIHNRAYEMHRIQQNKSRPMQNGLEFDEDGNMIERKNVFIVWGAPSSGKTTYVKEHKGKYDLVIDLDYIMAALNIRGLKQSPNDLLPFALDIRSLMYDLIAQRKHHFEKAWVIATLPEKEEREALRVKLKAELIYIDTNRDECRERARLDDERLNKEHQFRIIDRFFERLQM